MLRRVIVVLLFVLQTVLLGYMGWSACPNKTEMGHMGAAVYFWRTFRFDLFHVNPPLSRMIIGLPVVLSGPNYDWDAYSSRPQDRSEWAIGHAFARANGPHATRWYFTLARWSLMPVVLLGGYFGFRLSREMYGSSAGIVFLALWCFSPMVLAWGATCCPDVAAAALGIVAVYAFRRWLHDPTWSRCAVAGVCIGLLPLTKLTWTVAFGVWPLAWGLWTASTWLGHGEWAASARPTFRQLVAMMLIGLYTLNMGYLFDGTFRPLGKYAFASRLLSGREASREHEGSMVGNRFVGTWLGNVPLPLPAEFVQGSDTQRYDFERGMPSYLRGEWANHGWWHYYLYALAIKEPLGTWILVTMAIGMALVGLSRSVLPRDELLLPVVFISLLVLISSQSGFSVHSRYVLPVLPLLFVFTSRVGQVFDSRRAIPFRPLLATAIVAAACWSTASSMAIYPFSLSYFNELAVLLPTPFDASYPQPGGVDTQSHGLLSSIVRKLDAGPRHGPRHLLESNIDWGQDLFELEDWQRSHPEAQPMMVAYFGSFPLACTKIESAGLPPAGSDGDTAQPVADAGEIGPLPGWYAVSVNEIYSESQRYRYFLHYQPAAAAGYSIYVYHITIGDANRVRRALNLPELSIDWRPKDTPQSGLRRDPRGI